MRTLFVIAISIALLGSWACGNAPASSTDASASPDAREPAQAVSGSASIAGFAFVDSSVTGQGSRAKLPPGAKIYPPGSKIIGTDGCPTTPYRTDGLLVTVIDYAGRPTAGSVAVTRHPATGGQFADAPYYLDLDTGRTLQFLGPIFDNGSSDVLLTYHDNQGREKAVSAKLVLPRACRTTR